MRARSPTGKRSPGCKGVDYRIINRHRVTERVLDAIGRMSEVIPVCNVCEKASRCYHDCNLGDVVHAITSLEGRGRRVQSGVEGR